LPQSCLVCTLEPMKSRLLFLLGGFVLAGVLPLHGSALELFALIDDSENAQPSPLSIEGPRLSIEGHPQNFVVFWPLTANDWVLEQATDSDSGFRWSQVPPNLYSSNGARYEFNGAYATGVRYFRLRKLDPVAAGVTSQFPLDEGQGSNAWNASHIGGSLQLSNVTWAVGRVGPGALQFNGGPAATTGSRAWISNENYQLLPGANQPFSLSFWFSPSLLTPGWSALAGNNVTGQGWQLALSNPGPGTNILVLTGADPSATLVITGRALLLPDEWHHLTITYDGNVGSLYLDQILLGRSSGSLPTHPGPIYFGGAVGGFNSFNGRLDEIRTYTNCLSAEQIALRGYWRFDETDGSVVADAAIDGHHGVVSDVMARTAGRSAGGINLADGKVRIPNDDFTLLPKTGQPFSLSFWIQPGPLGTGRYGVMSSEDPGSAGWRMYVDGFFSGEMQLHFDSHSSGGNLNLSVPMGLNNGLWTKIDVTYNGGIATAYVNGRVVGSAPGGIQAVNRPLILGEVVGAAQFNGIIDELKIYSGERDAAEIGPLAKTMWETVLLNSTTNLILQGFGPSGKRLTYSIVSAVTPTNGSIAGIANSALARYSAGSRQGPDAFAYTVSDGEFTSAPAIVTVSVVEPHWLSPTGGNTQPLDGSSPAHAWPGNSADVLDAIWHTNNWYDCFFYAPGEYQTRGCSYGVRSTANPGCKHIGSGDTGPNRTVIKLVDTWGSWLEGTIFVDLWYRQTDAFEVHNMTLDCNAANQPKFNQGEPIWIHIPLAQTGRVDTVKILWGNSSIVGLPRATVDRAVEFRLSTRKSGVETYVTNYHVPGPAPDPTILPVQTDADEIYIVLLRRAAEHYGIREVTVDGNAISLATAVSSNGTPSRYQSRYDVCYVVDQNPGTFWVSGPDTQVDLTLPFEPGTSLTHLNIQWKCRTIPGIGRIGPALAYQIQARDSLTGNFYDVPFVRGTRNEFGAESVVFGAAGSAQVIVTDQLRVRLVAKEPLVDYYGIKEITVLNGPSLAVIRQPSAQNYLPWGNNYTITQAFDDDDETYWVSGTQGMVTAIGLYGNNLKFTKLNIVGFGTRSGKECFPMHCGMPGGATVIGTLGNVLVEDCRIAEPALNNTDGVTALVVLANLPSRYTNVAVRRCTFEDLRLFPYSHAASVMHLEDSTVKDCQVAIYYEPDGWEFGVVEPSLFRSNQFINVDWGVYAVFHPGARLDSITCLHNEIVLSGRTGWGFASCDACAIGPSGSITNLTLLNNVVRYADWSTRPDRRDGGILYSDMQHTTFGNNVIVLGTLNELRVRHCPLGLIVPPEPPDDCDFPVLPPTPPNTYPQCLDLLPLGYERSWYNNRSLSGELLPVRFLNSGIEGMATQQQWGP
jgi:hypothetical protein